LLSEIIAFPLNKEVPDYTGRWDKVSCLPVFLCAIEAVE